MVVLVTCPSKVVARRIAAELGNHRLAACVNMAPSIESIYRWQGKIEHAREVLLVIKTTAAGFNRLKRYIIALHPYDVPEVIGVLVTAGHSPYLQWVSKNTR